MRSNIIRGRTGDHGRLPFTKKFGKFLSGILGISVWEESVPFATRVQNVCACARSLFLNWRLRMRTSQQECLFLS